MALPIAFNNAVCKKCIKKQIEKYGEITIECSGLKTEALISNEISVNLSEDEIKLAIAEVDPVEWAAQNIVIFDHGTAKPWSPRKSKDSVEYQANMLRCTARRQVYQIGRRVGKCLKEGTLVMTPGGPIEIQNLKINDIVYAYSIEKNRVFEANVKNVINQGVQYISDLRIGNSTIASCTKEHRWGTVTKESECKVLSVENFGRNTEILKKKIYIAFGNEYDDMAYKAGIFFEKIKYIGDKIYNLSDIKKLCRHSIIELFTGIFDQHAVLYINSKYAKIKFNVKHLNTAKIIKWMLLGIFQEDSTIIYNDGEYEVIIDTGIVEIIETIKDFTVKDLSNYSIYKNYDFDKNKITRIEINEARAYNAWDITLDTKDSLYLLANGLVTHNTETLAVKILNKVDSIPQYRIAVIMPYQKQLNELFGRIRSYIASGMVSARVKKDNQTPNHVIVFSNGSKIDAHVAGPTSVTSLRSISANMIVTDEADYMDSTAWDTFLPILNDHPDTEFITSSTPSGIRGRYYTLANDPAYKVWHFPSHVIPHWTTKMDEEAKKSLTAAGYTHEILAGWGESETIAVKNQYIDRSIMKNYNRAISADSVVTIGVDWNSAKNGTRIVVLSKSDIEKVKIIAIISITAEKWTQLSAINKIFEVGRLYNADWVYIDAGYGDTQFELMQRMSDDAKTSHGHPWDASLIDKLKEINFGANISVQDPLGGGKIIKRSKLFLVENMIRFFEQDLIEIPEDEYDLLKQLRSYGVLRYDQNGIPIYGSLDSDIPDHSVDAFMLALAPLTLESTLYTRALISGGIITSKVKSICGFKKTEKSGFAYSELDKLPDDYEKQRVKNAEESVVDVFSDSFTHMPLGEYINRIKLGPNPSRIKKRHMNGNKLSGSLPGKRAWR